MKIEDLEKHKRGLLYDFESDSEPSLDFDVRIYTIDFYNPFDTLFFNKKGYNSFYNKVDKLHIETDLFESYFIYDVSGYNYWTLDMKESNYLFLTIHFKREVTDSEIESIFDEIEDKLLFPIQRKWDSMINNKNYTRKIYE